MECEVVRQPYKTPHFHPRHLEWPALLAWPFQKQHGSGRLNRLRTGVGRFHPTYTNGVWLPLRPVSVAYKNKPSTMLSSNVQFIDLPMDCVAWTVLDDETIEWLLNTFPEIQCSLAVDGNNSLKRRLMSSRNSRYSALAFGPYTRASKLVRFDTLLRRFETARAPQTFTHWPSIPAPKILTK